MSKDIPLVAIVDDDASVRKAIQRLLRSAGRTAEAFSSGEDFLSSLRSHTPDCVILDLHMPGVTGFDVLDRITADGVAVPVVIITGHDSPDAYERAMAGGAMTYLRKPVNDVVLLEAVRQGIEEGRSG